MDSKKMTGNQLWKRAKEIIPGGSQLLSKRSEMFLPDGWPSYFEKAKGCEVWDKAGNHYYDFAQMGVGTCTLGYADPDVNEAVNKAVLNGSMSSLNSYEEVELAEKLIKLHPWAEMARFARTGGEACAIGVRIARAASGNDKVAFCGYHGWHDWYLSANLADDSNLDGQLLPGLMPKGVPRVLKDTALPFSYNKLEELKNIQSEFGQELGVIIVEPQRGHKPKPGFLEGLRRIANETGAVLIFDEITSGFRMNVGGIHLTMDVEPDMALFGKALGNGFPIAAIIGKKPIMDIAQESFISSTFWTERIGFTAALKTLSKMEKHNVPEYLMKYGNQINEGWRRLANQYNLDINISGIPPLTHLSFNYNNGDELQTLYTQQMLGKGYLLGASVYTTYAYTDDIIQQFISDSGEVFSLISEAIKNGDISERLKGPVKHSGFKRLT